METLKFLTPEQAEDVARDIRHPTVTFTTSPRCCGRRRRRAGFPKCLRPHRALRDEGEPECGHPPHLRRLRSAHRRQLGLRMRAGHARGHRAGTNLAQHAGISGGLLRSFRKRHSLQCLSRCIQLGNIRRAFPGREFGVRFNPGVGSGGTSKTNVGGPSSCFGIWHESFAEVQTIAAKHSLRVVRIHTHIGSGSDPGGLAAHGATCPSTWCGKFPDVTTLNLGGGYKVGAHGLRKRRPISRRSARPMLRKVQGARRGDRADNPSGDRAGHLPAGEFLRALVTTIQDVVEHRRGGLPFSQARHGHDRDPAPLALRSQHPHHRCCRASEKADTLLPMSWSAIAAKRRSAHSRAG